MKRALFGATLVLAMAPGVRAAADSGACSYTAQPTIELSLDGPPNALTGQRELVEHWRVGCAATCDASSATKFWDGVSLFFASERGTELTGVNTLGPGSDVAVSSGDHTLDSPISGVKIFPVFKGGCGTQVTSSGLVSTEGSPIVVPPYLPTPDRITVQVDDPTWNSLPILASTAIPLNRRFHIRANIGAQPKGAEAVIVNVIGAGIDFHKRYTGAAGGIGEQLAADPDASLLATRPDSISMNLEFEGTQSDTQTLTVVPYDENYSPIPSGTTGSTSAGDTTGSPGTTGSSAAKKSAGCSAAGGGASLLSLLGLAGLRRRRR